MPSPSAKAVSFLGAFVLASLPLSAQRISADALNHTRFPQVLRGHLDGRPHKSAQPPAVFAAQMGRPSSAIVRHDPPAPIVSPYFYPSSRSSSVNYGMIVGPNPLAGGSSRAQVKAFLIPLVIRVHQVATDFALDANNNLILSGIQNQTATYDVTAPSHACLGARNNVPFTLAVQSPVFQDHHWVFNGTDLGNAQYNEAFQRANFWNAGRYDLHLNPQVLPPLLIDFPAGTAIGLPQSSSLLGYSACAPTVLVDFNLFDAYLDYYALPELAAYGVNSGNFPVFLGGNVLWGAVSGQLPYFEPEAAGYHSYSSVDPAQTYAATQFGDEGVFTWPDAVPLSHEIGEWMNDPQGSNAVQAYNVTTVSNPTGAPACQGNYEVGDILAGSFMPPVTMNNGYTYTLQELAYFSWFYGGPSIAADGAYSNNGTLTTDAGAACSPF